jgi:hypothetical protein
MREPIGFALGSQLVQRLAVPDDAAEGIPHANKGSLGSVARRPDVAATA